MQTDLFSSRTATVDQAWSVRMADAAITRYLFAQAKWHYEHGLLLLAIEQVWRVTGAVKYWHFIQDTIDLFVDADGNIRTYQREDYNLDQINPGKLLFSLWHSTGDRRYALALHRLRQQLTHQPRTPSGGFWHKLIYPQQMWLDGLYMAAPFYAQYALTFGGQADFDEVVHQITLLEEHARDPHTGLLYHAWDESKQQRWANPVTGCSPHFWGRALGWYAMALVDVLDYLPREHARRSAVIAILQRLVEAVAAVQDPATGLWSQVIDQATRPGNYEEASASCMLVYAIAKAVRQAYVPIEQLAIAQRGYQGILTRLVSLDERGQVNLSQVCSVAGLGGDPYRDGSYEYYIHEPVVVNDLKGVGPFILASLELEAVQRSQPLA